MSAEVAVYVQSKYAKPAYTVESYNVRAWPGLQMVCHALRKAGIEVDYCSSATAGRYKVVLVSICPWSPGGASARRSVGCVFGQDSPAECGSLP